MRRDYDPQNVRPARKVNDIAGEMRVDTYLTNFSVSWRQDQANFVAPFAATPIPVQNSSDKYAIYPAGYFWRWPSGPGGLPRPERHLHGRGMGAGAYDR
jgi:hypothetical protein